MSAKDRLDGKSRRKGGIHIKPSHEGLLHKEMGIKQEKKISTGSLEKEKVSAERSHDVKKIRQVVFAENARKWHHRG